MPTCPQSLSPASRISSGFSDKHVETLEGEELDAIAILFEVRIHDATQKLLAARIGL